MKYRKQYINVDVVFDASGRMRPQVIHWVDGRQYEISRVKAIVPAAAVSYTHLTLPTNSRV